MLLQVFAPDTPLPLMVSRMDPQPAMGLHRHDVLELVLITGGRGRHLLRDGAYPIARGDVYVIPVGVEHGYDHCEALTLCNVIFAPRRLQLPERQLAELPGYQALFSLEPRLRPQRAFAGHLQLDERRLATALDLIVELDDELDARRPGHDLAAIAQLQRLLIHLARSYDAREDPAAQKLLHLADVLQRIERRSHEALRVEQIADWAHCSRSQLHRLFREALGCTPLEHLTALRLREAERLLRSTQLEIAEIARRIGIPDANYFARLFRRKRGCRPSDLRAAVPAR